MPGASLITEVVNDCPPPEGDGGGADLDPPPNMLLTIDPIINLFPFVCG